MTKVFERGDIVSICLNPTLGRELQGEGRPVMVLSESQFNRLGLVMIAPITQGGDFSRIAGFTVSLTGAGTKTQGVVLVNMIRSVDPTKRSAKFLERAPQFIVQDVLARASAIFEDDGA